MKILIKPIALLVLSIVFVWIVLLFNFIDKPLMLGLSVVAFSLGARHGFDVDHIAAIDNVTRKMLYDGKMPLSVGVFFALGHSSVVFILTGLVVIGAISLQYNSSIFFIGGLIGTFVSISFLWLTAGVNLYIFCKFSRKKTRILEHSTLKIGLFSRLFQRYFSFINQSWQMLIVGFLFGLGFDTATEIALLSISGTQAVNGASVSSVMLLPVAFASGMCLIDALDGWLVISLNGWVTMNNNKNKFYYNLFITALLTIVSFGIGLFQLISYFKINQVSMNWFDVLIKTISNNSELIGLSVVIIFIISWIFMKIIFKKDKEL